MKKLLILMLILGVTSAANAAFSLVVGGVDVGDEVEVDPLGVITIGIHNDTAGMAGDTKQLGAYLLLSGIDNGGWLAANNVYAPPSVVGSANSYLGVDDWLGTGTQYDLYYGALYNGIPTDFSGVGIMADYDFECKLANTEVLIELMNEDTGEIVDSVKVIQTPEPITFALLGVGGLFLRRRK